MINRKRKLNTKPIIQLADVFRPVTSLDTTLPEVTETTTAKTVESPEEVRRLFNLWYEDKIRRQRTEGTRAKSQVTKSITALPFVPQSTDGFQCNSCGQMGLQLSKLEEAQVEVEIMSTDIV